MEDKKNSEKEKRQDTLHKEQIRAQHENAGQEVKDCDEAEEKIISRDTFEFKRKRERARQIIAARRAMKKPGKDMEFHDVASIMKKQLNDEE